MKDILIIILLFVWTTSNGQSYRQPSMIRNECGSFHNDSIRRLQTVDSIFKVSGILLTEHPLAYAQRLQINGLSRTDTLYDKKENTITIRYYDNVNRLFKEEVIWLNSKSKKSFCLVFDYNGNEIFRETIDCNSFNLRFRSYFDKNNKKIIECVHSSSSGLDRIDISLKNKSVGILTNCKCDF